MTSVARVGLFCARLCAIVILCLVTIASVYAQEMEAGAIPPTTSGEHGAPITIEVFNDYQCPPCGSMNEELKKVEAKYRNQVLFVFRNYPLVNFHPNALAAAKAADAAGMQGKFRNMIDLLYTRLEEWSNEKDPTNNFVSYAKELELDVKVFMTDITSENVANRIGLDIKRAKFLGVKGTPALFVNGKELDASDHNNLLEIVGKAF